MMCAVAVTDRHTDT